MSMKKHTSNSAFTLIELLASIVVMSIISVTLLPVIGAASDGYASSRAVRSSTERAGFALDRITRIARQAPIGSGDVGVGITSASSNSIEYADGSGVQLVGSTLEMLVLGASPVPLCFDVDSFSIDYYADDGITSTSLTPTLTHRFVFTIVTQGVELSVLVHPRVWVGQEAP